MRQTVVGVFDRYATARQAAQQLRESGFGDSVSVTDEISSVEGDAPNTRNESRDESGFLAQVRYFFADLFGDDDKEVSPYADALRRGGGVVRVEVNVESEAEAARAALEAAGAETRKSGVRVYPREVQPPADAIETKQLGSGTANAGIVCGSGYLSHFEANYAQSGARWEDYEPAYRYGDELRSEARYTGRGWDEVEPDLRSDWESRNAGPWEKFKGAIRHAWERITS